MEALASWRIYSYVKQANKKWQQFNTIWDELILKIEQTILQQYVPETM